MDYFSLLKPVLHKMPEEAAHDLAINALKNGLVPKQKTISDPVSQTKIWGLDFPNPVGLAAGFDKNGEAISPLLQQGFGFIEVGTVTPKPQFGNPKPRLFRLVEDDALINRLGFNNDGAGAFVKKLKNRNINQGIVGANIGKNKESEHAVSDYTIMMEHIYGLSDYITINISSPNTPGLRELQKREALQEFLGRISEKRDGLRESSGENVPLLLKASPDISEPTLQAIAELSLRYQVDGIIIGNSTLNEREQLQSVKREEEGGVSGKPLFERSTSVLREMYEATDGNIPLVGLGGIFTGEDAYTKIRAGASLVQIYTVLIYKGFGVVSEINKQLAELLKRDGFNHIADAVGVDAKNT